MRQSGPGFILIFVLLVIAQMVICNFLNLTPFIMLSILPVMILCLPLRVGQVASMLIAFATGMAVDFFAEGLPGINAASLVPVAFIRLWVIRLVFGNELFARGEDFTTGRSGLGKVVVATLILQGLFLAIYIAIDGAGVRPFWFNALRWIASLLAGTFVSIFVADLLAGDGRKK
ncbi:MAG: hypothetical protein J6W74_03600 [Bacteroidales bacterium]|nr:hypothetical protein [Bacteroidales bacterium]